MATVNDTAGPILKGLRIAVTAADLEQQEHRGIAAYSKNLIESLHRSGAEVWLITEFDPKQRMRGVRNLPFETKSLLKAAKILDDLCGGHSSEALRDYSLPQTDSIIREKLTALSKKLANKLLKNAPFLVTAAIRKNYEQSRMETILPHQHRDNPYLRSERLAYIDNITGILCAPRFFGNANLMAGNTRSGVVIMNLTSFDAIISTCPINIDSNQKTPIIQTIHDLIPVEFARHGENPVTFTRRLQASKNHTKIFMSEASQRKYEHYIISGTAEGKTKKTNKTSAFEAVAIQPPSLQLIESEITRAKTKENEEPWSWSPNQQSKKRLRNRRYILFNSSIEPRKNVIFLIKFYQESQLGDRGYHLCITGTIKSDSYSQEVRKLVEKDSTIMLTGYVDESTKAELYSRALALVSPSLVEGFGIPVLDAACIGLATIASDSDSHKEIRRMHDFSQYITLLRTTRTTPWATLLKRLADEADLIGEEETEVLIGERKVRFIGNKAEIEKEFSETINTAVLSATSRKQ